MKYMNPFYDNPFIPNLRLMLLINMFFVSLISMGQQKLRLNDAILEGLVNNYQIKVAKNETEISFNNFTYGNAGFFPVVSAYGSIDKAWLNAKVKVVGGSELDNQDAEANLSIAGVKAEWTLFDGTAMFSKYEKLRSLWKISDLETRLSMEEVAVNIIVAYSNIIRQKVLLDACRQKLQSSEMRKSVAHSKLGSGLGSEQEYLQSAVALQADSTDLIKQLSELRKSKIILNRILAREIEKEIITDDSISIMEIPDFEQLKTNALQYNNLLKLSDEQLIYSKIEEKMLKSEHYPKLAVTGTYGYFENNTEAAFIRYNRYFGPQIGINLGMKLFDGMRVKQSVKNARINTENKELLYQDMREQVMAVFSETYLDYQSSAQASLLGKEGLRLAQKNLDIALKAYQSGMISSVQLRIAQDDLFRASSELVNAYFEVKVKETELLRICGLLIK